MWRNEGSKKKRWVQDKASVARVVWVWAAFAVLLTTGSALRAAEPAGGGAEVKAGKYVFQIAGCRACHTEEGKALVAGGPGLDTPFGTFFAPNITPDAEHGIGAWKIEDFVAALGEGVAPDGGDYYPVFPFTSYTQMTRGDAETLFAYLQQLPADATPRKDHDIPWYLGFRILNWFWKLLFFERGPLVPDPAQSPEFNRGAYVAQALAHCGECHTPRNIFGAVDESLHLAGNPHGPEDALVPNITPHDEHGVGLWSPADLVSYLTFGEMPDGDYAGGAMAEVIDAGLSNLTADDAKALAAYLAALAPNPHSP
ncbi:MAG: mono/diheme cytochrome c family protein [Gammaproteobacteria bacterium]|jgi:mono/diheme cytochrome c family protein